MGKTIVGFIVMRPAEGTYRHRDFRWRPEKAKAQVFKSERSARISVGIQQDTPEFTRWKAAGGNRYWWRYSGRKYTYDNTGQEFIPVYADD